ncbi:acyltransferase family protein [Lactiplantibacillus songbeiensis]|uniref:Acyltransferase family protein n=1 Tax=Lactiplantibacillus songbeiensis TaxID=2559920 RepID=A0ABW4C160_9LACO|nr:acyltransferase family protein [Lactiplantibacillus songbeiensis]
MTKRVNWVDSARGIAIILVVYGHALEGTFYSVGMNQQSYDWQHGIIYAFHMPLFFLISGFFIASWLKRQPAIALKQKAVALLIPYVIWSIIQGTFMILMKSKSVVSLGWKALLYIPIRPLDQFWFVYALFFAFILYYFIFNYLGKSITISLFVSLFIVIVLSFIHIWQFSNIGLALFFIALGAFIHERIGLNYFSKSSVGIISTLLFLSIFSIISILNYSLTLNIIIKLILAVLGSVSILVFSNKFSTKFLTVLGKLSLEIYVAHWIFLAGSRFILIHFGLSQPYLLIAVGTICGIIFPIILYQLLLNLHISKYVFGR